MATIIITGANGFIGSELVRYLSAKGHAIRALSRSKPAGLPENVTFYEYDLSTEPPEEPFIMADALIHCAYVKYSPQQKNAHALNRSGTYRLLETSRRNEIKKFIYFSSFSSHAESLSHYGQSKFEIEKIFDNSRDLILKPGLVLGKRGTYANLQQVILSRRIIPVFGDGRQPVQSIYIDDLLACIGHALEYNICGTFPLAEKEILPLEAAVKIISETARKKTNIVRIPFSLALGIIKLAGMFNLKFPVSRENLLSLKSDISYDTSKTEEVFKVNIRPFRESVKELANSPSSPF
ncbi:MAG TPA: NAD(P)-dependent oxidoreductase [Bacteroidales bacterium]|nr:NAD(P)-dependent oxidoreductase [Bacteroidales bacterium]